MIEDVYEPLARYRDEFRERFARLTREKFKALTEASGIDVPANRRTVAQVRKLEEAASRQRFKKTLLGTLMVLAFVVGVVAFIMAFNAHDTESGSAPRWGLVGTACIGLGFLFMRSFGKASELLSGTESAIVDKKTVAWAQMAALNSLYTWDVTVKLIEATVPRIDFDPYFTVERLASLRDQFGWDDGFNDGKSVIFAQSGVINGNPFVFGQYLDMEWGEKTYEGTKEISWTEWEEDSEGRRHLVRRYETLYAHVTKPIPVYGEHKLLVYGNDAAPNLSFSREPSGLTGSGGGLWGKVREKWRLMRLKSYSRNLKDDSQFTLMANHEFEAWFHAKDRDDEVEFRLLFTPVAQMQMLALMKDTKVGYGDDFSFIKRRKVNVMMSDHLDEATIDTDPARFRNWDYDAAASFFMAFNERYFKDAYFSLAPLLSIPLYQQTKTHEEIWKGVIDRRAPSFWEQESIANYHGEGKFAHPDSITRNILKTDVVERENGESVVAVTAHGFEGVDRVDYEEVYGGDGEWHSVPVPWTEYLPVERTSEMRLCERTPSESFSRRAAASPASAFRRSILSYISAH